MEGDDGAIARVPLYIINDILGRHPLGVVAGDEVPHHDLVLSAEPGILTEAHPSMGRTHQTGVDIGIGLLYVIAILLDGVGESLDVVVGVITHLMALSDNAFIEFRILAHVVADHEEGGLGSKLLEGIEDKWCCLGDGTVVEGQVDGLLVTVHSPIGFRIEPAEIDGWLFDKHFPTLLLLLPLSSLRLVEAHHGFKLGIFLLRQLLVDAVLNVEDLLHDDDVNHTVALGDVEA